MPHYLLDLTICDWSHQTSVPNAALHDTTRRIGKKNDCSSYTKQMRNPKTNFALKTRLFFKKNSNADGINAVMAYSFISIATCSHTKSKVISFCEPRNIVGLLRAAPELSNNCKESFVIF